MSIEAKAGTQTLGNSSNTTDLGPMQEPELDFQEIEPSASELTLKPVDERIKYTTDPILRRVEELCALLAGRIELQFVGNSEVSGSRCDKASTSLSRNRHDNV